MVPSKKTSKSGLSLDIKQDKISLVEKGRQLEDDKLSQVAKDYNLAVSNKKKYSILMDLMSNDGREQKRGAMKLLEENKID